MRLDFCHAPVIPHLGNFAKGFLGTSLDKIDRDMCVGDDVGAWSLGVERGRQAIGRMTASWRGTVCQEMTEMSGAFDVLLERGCMPHLLVSLDQVITHGSGECISSETRVEWTRW